MKTNLNQLSWSKIPKREERENKDRENRDQKHLSVCMFSIPASRKHAHGLNKTLFKVTQRTCIFAIVSMQILLVREKGDFHGLNIHPPLFLQCF